jgi:hypothetical protein
VTAIIKVIASVLAVVKNIQLLEVGYTLGIYSADVTSVFDTQNKMLIASVVIVILF